MSYITNSDIETRLGSQAYVQLTDDDGDGTANSDVVDEARLGAEGEVNGYLARRYQVPIDVGTYTELSGLLASICLDLVELRLRSRRPPAPREAIERAERTRLWLKGVAGGSIALPGVGTLPPSATEGIVAESLGETRRLFLDDLAGL